MSLVRKMQEGAKTPTLYTMYGKQYDFDELQRATDQGLAEHLSTLKRGSKDEAQFRDAYNNIMMGIRDGSITYQDGRFVDTKYGYHNSSDKDKNKDHYGLMANYIFNKMGKSPEYVKPEDKTKIKWNGSASIGNALIRYLYNSDTENIRDFVDIDEPDKTTKKRGTTGRAKWLSTAFSDVLSKFDTLFTGYTPTDKADAEAYIHDAIKSLNDGSIDAGDYLALSRAASGLNYRDMFSVDKEYITPQQRVTEVQDNPNGAVQGQRQAFVDWIEQKYPQFSGTLQSPRSLATSKAYGPGTLQSLSNAMGNLSNNDLYRIVRSALSDSKYVFNNEQFIRNTFKDADYGFLNPFGLQKALETLKGKGLLQSFGENNLNLYYIPNTDNSARQTAWVWDDQAGTVSEMSYHDIPYWREKIKQEWLTSNGGTSDNSYWASRYFKTRGILKAQTGAIMDRHKGRGPGITGNNTWLAVPNTATNAYNIGTWDTYYNNAGIDQDIMQDNPNKFWNYGYRVDEQGHPLRDEEGNDLHGISAAQLGTYLNQLNELGSGLSWNKIVNDKGYEAWNRKFDQTGLNMYFGGDSNKFDFMGPSTWNRHALLQRMQNTYNKENPLAIGEDKLYWDGHKWNLSLPEIKPQLPEIDINTNPINPQIATDSTGDSSTKINLTTGDQNKPKGTGQGFLSALGAIAPDLIGAGRLAISLNTNNRVAKTIRPTLTPVLKNTYERFSPITGDLYSRQSGYKRAGDIQSRFSRPITSDASLYASTMLDANRQATALQSQADAADNQEIKRTSAEALARVEDNMARRSDVANFNRASMNQTNREIAQLEATRLKSNWQSWDNYLQGIEGRLRQRYDADKDRRDNFRLTVATNDIENTFQERIKDATAQVEAWRAANRGASITTMPGYKQYEELIKEATRWKNAETYAAHAGVYGYDYTNPYANKSWADTAARFNFKTGGSLRPSALHLINKVIRNESNS